MVNHNEWAGERVRNIYPLLVNKTVYEGIRKDMPGKRTMILTRSGFSGLQRYAAATWSGDVGNDWETFRRQIVGWVRIYGSRTSLVDIMMLEDFSGLEADSMKIRIFMNVFCVGFR